MVKSESIILSLSMAKRIPKPSHSLHAPLGELNENESGSSGSKEILQSKQALCSE